MARPTLLSDRPRSTDAGADSAPAAAAPTSDFAQWLTRDLRAKGTPSEGPPAERPSQPQAVVITDSTEPELASWLLRDLKPRGSVPPDALNATRMAPEWESAVPPAAAPVWPAAPESLVPPAPAESLVPAESRVSAESPASAESLVPPDSLVPMAVSEAPATLARREATLDEEDLAVLPSRRRKKRDWRKLVVLAALLSVVGALLWVAEGSQSEKIAGVAASAAPAVLTAPLPPPPPSEAEALDPPAEPQPVAPAPLALPGGPAAAEPELELERARRGRRAGDAVARFADLPSPTLSRLAREELRRGRKSRPAAEQPAAERAASKQLASSQRRAEPSAAEPAAAEQRPARSEP